MHAGQWPPKRIVIQCTLTRHVVYGSMAAQRSDRKVEGLLYLFDYIIHSIHFIDKSSRCYFTKLCIFVNHVLFLKKFKT